MPIDVPIYLSGLYNSLLKTFGQCILVVFGISVIYELRRVSAVEPLLDVCVTIIIGIFRAIGRVIPFQAEFLFPVIRHTIMVAVCGRRCGFVLRPTPDIGGGVYYTVLVGGFACANDIDYAFIDSITPGQRGTGISQHELISLPGTMLGDRRGGNRRSRAYLLNDGLYLCCRVCVFLVELNAAVPVVGGDLRVA
jgi:hypothetical protein